MKTTIILSLILASLLSGCRNNEETTENPPIEHQEAVHPEQVGKEDDIELNNGELWEVNRQTTEGVERLSQVLQNSTPTSVEEYRELGNRLEEEKNNIDSTLKLNEPYSQGLESYLDRLEEKIGRLQEVDSQQDGARLKSEIQEQLSSYSNYFRSE